MFDRFRQLVRAHPVVAFYALAFPLSWRAYLLAWVHPGGELGLDPYGPLVAAVVVTALAGGLDGLKSWGRSLLRWRARALALRLRAPRAAGAHARRHRGKRGARRDAAGGREVGGLADAPGRLPAGDGPRRPSRRGARVARTGAGPRRRAPPDAAGEPRGRRGLVRLAPAAAARPAGRAVARASSASCRRRSSSAGCTSARTASCCSPCSCTPRRTRSAVSSPGRCSRARTSPAWRGSVACSTRRRRSSWCSAMLDSGAPPSSAASRSLHHASWRDRQPRGAGEVFGAGRPITSPSIWCFWTIGSR